MPSFAVLRSIPLTESKLQTAVRHDERENTHLDDHIASDFSHLNRTVFGSDSTLNDCEAILELHPISRVNKNKEPPIVAQFVLTAAREWFDEIGDWRAQPEILDDWIDANVVWLKEKFPNGLAHVSLHLDEETPHLNAYIVPVCDRIYTLVGRDGIRRETTKKVVSYNGLLGDSKSTLARARDSSETSDITKLGRLQTSYGEAMSPFGLLRGIRKSKAKHVTTAEHRKRIQTATQLIDFSVLDKRQLVDIAASSGVEINMLKNENDRLKSELSAARGSEHKMIEELRKNKEYIASLRSITPLSVSEKLGISEADMNVYIQSLRGKKFNAIDFVTLTNNGFKFDDSVMLLAQHFPLQTPAIVAENALEHAQKVVETVQKADLAAPFVRVPTRAEQVKIQAISRQCDALQADGYRVVLRSDDEKLPSYNIGKSKNEGKPEKLFTKEELIQRVPFLSAKNASSYNNLVTPISNKYFYHVEDDLTEDTLKQYEADGYQPSLVLQTSPNSIQAISVIKREDISHKAGNTLFKRLNRLYGDANITGFIHPIRLAGFANRKLKRMKDDGHFPFVIIIKAIFRIDQKFTFEARAIDAEMVREATLERIASLRKRDRQMTEIVRFAADRQRIELARNWYRTKIDYWGNSTDLSKLDYELARTLRAEGFSDIAAQDIIEAASPDISRRHPRLREYLFSKTRELWVPVPVTPIEPVDQVDRVDQEDDDEDMGMGRS